MRPLISTKGVRAGSSTSFSNIGLIDFFHNHTPDILSSSPFLKWIKDQLISVLVCPCPAPDPCSLSCLLIKLQLFAWVSVSLFLCADVAVWGSTCQ